MVWVEPVEMNAVSQDNHTRAVLTLTNTLLAENSHSSGLQTNHTLFGKQESSFSFVMHTALFGATPNEDYVQSTNTHVTVGMSITNWRDSLKKQISLRALPCNKHSNNKNKANKQNKE